MPQHAGARINLDLGAGCQRAHDDAIALGRAAEVEEVLAARVERGCAVRAEDAVVVAKSASSMTTSVFLRVSNERETRSITRRNPAACVIAREDLVETRARPAADDEVGANLVAERLPVVTEVDLNLAVFVRVLARLADGRPSAVAGNVLKNERVCCPDGLIGCGLRERRERSLRVRLAQLGAHRAARSPDLGPRGVTIEGRTIRAQLQSQIDTGPTGYDSTFWFARNIGKVKESGTEVRELVGYSIPQ